MWNGSITTVSLGARWYRSASDMDQTPSERIEFEVGTATIFEEDIPRTDCSAINEGKASITPLGSWPSNHPLGIGKRLLESSINESPDGLPYWI